YEADGEGAGAFETDTYYGFGGAPAAVGDAYNPATPNQDAPGQGWSWSASTPAVNGWPVAGYGYTKWLWNHFMPGATEVPDDGIAVPLPAGGDVPDVVFTDAEAMSVDNWSHGANAPYQFGIIKYAQTSWLKYSPGPMTAYTENYWFGENHYMPGPGSSIAADTSATINYVATPVLNAPTTANDFDATPTVTFNQPVDAKGRRGIPAMGYAIMGTGGIDQNAFNNGTAHFFGGNGVGNGYSTGVWISPGKGGSGYAKGTKDTPNVTFQKQVGDQSMYAGSGYIEAVDSNGAILSIAILDPGDYNLEPSIVLPATTGTVAEPEVYLTPANGYPRPVFPVSGGAAAAGFLSVSTQGSVNPGQVTNLTLRDAGSGYAQTPNTSVQFAPITTFTSDGGIPLGPLTILDGGSGYTAQPDISIYKPQGGIGPSLDVVMAGDGDKVQSVTVTATGSGYSTANPPTITVTPVQPTGYDPSPSGPLAGPGGIPVHFDTTVNGTYHWSPVISQYPTAMQSPLRVPTLYAPVTASGRQVAQIVITVLGDHYDTATSKPYYTLSGDTSQTKHYLSGGVNGNGINPNYNGAYVPALDLSGGFPVDPTGRSAITILDCGFGYSAGAVVENPGAGYDNQTTYAVNFPAPQGGGTAATGLLLVNSDGAVTGIVITSAGSGYTSTDDGRTVTLPTPGADGTAATAQMYLSHYPTVTITSNTTAVHTPASPYVITGPTDPKNPQLSDRSTGYIVTGIGFNYPGVGYQKNDTFTFKFSDPAANGTHPTAAALPALGTKFSANQLPVLAVTDPASATQIQGGANAFNWQISNGYGPGQVSKITNLAGGSGYTSAPAVKFPAKLPPGGKTARAHAVGNGGVVTQIVIDDPGYGYDPSQPFAVTIAAPGGTGTQATATVVLGDVPVLSMAALHTVYANYASRPDLLAAMFNDQLYQDVALPKLSEEFYSPLVWTDFTNPNSTDGTQVPQRAIATFSIESLNRSNTFDDQGNYVPGAITKTCLDAKYQSDVSLGVPNTLGGTFSGLSSLTYAQFVDFLNSAATIIANNAGPKPDGTKMLPQDVTFQVYDAAFLPLEWITQANPNRWSAVNAAPVFGSQAGGSVVENTPHATPIYVAHASDVGTTWAERTVTYGLKPGVGDVADLTIDSRSGEVRLLRPANYEAKRSYAFVVVASDGGSPALTSERSVTVTVDDVPEDPTAPAIAAPARFTVLEDGATRLTFSPTPFSDADSAAHKPMTVSLGVPVGRIAAASGAGVTVGGSARRRTLSGRLDAINAYLAAGRVSYVPEAGAVAARTLSIVISESYRSFSRRATAESVLDVSPVDDAPRVQSPARFRVLEDTPGNLVWPAGITPFSDDDSAVLTVTLSVDRGVIASTGDEGVTVGGSDTARTFRGALADLNRLFRRPGGIIYTPATDDTAAVTLTTTVADGVSQAVASSRIMVLTLNDAPTQRASGLMLGATAGRPVRIDPDQLATATVARDVDSRRVSFLLTGTTRGQVERLVGGRWVPMRTTGPVATRLIDGRDPVRWVAPAGALGTTPAFTVQAWDGRLASTTISQISVSIAATDDTAFAYFIDDTKQVSNVPAGYGVIGEFSETERAAAVASGRIVGESVAMFNQQSDNTVGYSLWPLIAGLFASRDVIQPGDRMALAEQILTNVLVNKGLTATSEFPSPDEGVPSSPGAGYVIWAQDFEFTSGVVPTTDVYAGVTAVLWAGRTYLGDSFKIMPVPSSSLFKTLGDITGNGMGDYVADEIINGTASTPYLASLGLEGLPENPQHGSNGEWNFLSLLYANGLIDGFFGQNYNTAQVGIVTPDTLPFHDASLPYAIQSAHDNPTQVASGGPWNTVYNGDVPFHATVYWLANVDPTWGQPPKKPVLQPTQAPLPTTAFAAYGRSN
ncbi:MAG: cadherin domain-containing protein, partial [Planctomycetaceae bacterium]